MTEHNNAALDWDEQGQPLSRSFGDVYFSRASGLEETRYVFLTHNQLTERFAALPTDTPFCIGETGFGTGLSFLCAWQLFEQTAPSGAHLHFVSVEKYPLTHADLARALALWPELATQRDALLAQYHAIHPGFQRLVFAGGRVVLTLLIGDVLEQLPTLDARVNAWFLDGFSPAKNPAMWTPALFAELARLSAPDATLATFTCAGFVRRGLNDAGFQMAKVKGFGHKREMLAGHFRHAPPDGVWHAPWYARPPQFTPKNRHAVVIGAGLAGCATAASLAARGWRVTVLERRAKAAAEASGNPQGVLYLKLSAHNTPLSSLVLAGFGHTRRLLSHTLNTDEWNPCGVLQLAFNDKEAKRHAQLAAAFPRALLEAITAETAREKAGISLEKGGLWYPDGAWVHPPALCRALLQHPNIQLKTHHEALRLMRENEDWAVFGEADCLARAPLVVLCAATDVQQFAEAAHLPLKRIRGQITRLNATPHSQALNTVLCAEGYVAPAWRGEHTLGASFNFQRHDLTPSTEEHAENMQMLAQISPLLHAALTTENDAENFTGRVGFRSTTPDYLPLVGPLADAEPFRQTYAVLRRNARRQPTAPTPWLPGLYVNAGHGSRGLITAPLCAELLAAWLHHEPLPLPRAVAEACHPARFLVRELVRG